MTDLAWVDRANCAGVDFDTMFPPPGRGTTRQAKAVCQGCTVRAECLDHALAHGESYGVWGGLTTRERLTEARRRRTLRRSA